MKCRAWINSKKLTKKGRPSLNGAIGLDSLDWDWHCDPKNVGRSNAARMESLRVVAVRCGGPISASISDGDEDYPMEIEYRCGWCLQETYPDGLPKSREELEADLQARVDAQEFSHAE